MGAPDCRIPGPGDEATWPAYSGHANDPRAPEPPDWDYMSRDERRAELDEHFEKAELICMYLDEVERVERLLARLARAGIRE